MSKRFWYLDILSLLFAQRPRRETFKGKTVGCIDKNDEPTYFPIEKPITDASDTNTTESGRTNVEKKRNGLCRRRAVTVNEGCSNVIYAIDCSRRMNKTGFNYSLKFVKLSVSLFDIDRGQANIALFTYDDQVYTHFKLGEINDTERAIKAINSVPYCGKARTSPSLVLLKIAKEIKERSNESCKTAVFFLTNGHIADCSGNLMNASARIKEIPNVEIYTIAFGDITVYWDVLRSLASNKDYVFVIRHPGDFKKAIDDAHDVKLGTSIIGYSVVSFFVNWNF